MSFQKSWHALPLPEVFSATRSNKNGLTSEEAKQRLKKSGPNLLPAEKPYSKIRLFFGQFNNSLMYILLVTVAISFFLKHYSDSVFICIVLLINTLVSFYQENKANQSLAALKKMVRIKVRVTRDGYEREVDSEELVPGDVVTLVAGEKVPADGRLIEARGLKMNESSLTGEWLASEKEAGGALADTASLSGRKNMVFMSTIVERGWAKMVVVATATSSQIGEVVSLLKETKEAKTPLQKKITVLSRWIAFFIILVIGIILLEGYLTGKNFTEVFIASLALAVSAIPEGLLPAITVILIIGMRRILKQKGLVRKLSATETLGSVTVICTDKTGTLTEGNMRVSHILTGPAELMEEKDVGFITDKKIKKAGSHILALEIAALTSDGFIENPEAELQEWVVRGRPTDKALILAGMEAGLNKKELENTYPAIDKVPFESDYKFSATLRRKTPKENMLYVLGAPEEIIARCTSLDSEGSKKSLSTAQLKKLTEKLEFLAQKGLRILACAYRNYGPKKEYGELIDLVSGLSLIGFIALKDPLRSDAKESILITKKAGMRTVIVTGDHRFTAKAIAEEIGLKAGDENILEGKDLENIDDGELKEIVNYISIFARVSPKHKLRIVDAFQANGEVVAMLGDGVNDAPALKSADIGVAVGSGTDVAKEVADLVLLDNNFKTILKAVEQGRVIFQNIRKVFIYLVSNDFSEIFLFLGSVFLGMPLPLLPAQILWINLVEDSFPGIALTAEQETAGVMEEKPRNQKEPILNKSLKLLLTSIFVINGTIILLFYIFLWKVTGDISKTRTMVFALTCLSSLAFVFVVRSFKKSVIRKDIFSNNYLNLSVLFGLVLLFGAIYIPPVQNFLSTQALNATDWLIIFGIGFVDIFLIALAQKKLFFQKSLIRPATAN